MARVKEKMKVVLPLTLFIVFGLIYMNTKSMAKTSIVLLAVPFSAVGAIWLLYALGYNMSIGVWVGLIALLGLDAETGIFMLLYLDLAHAEAKEKGLLRNGEELNAAILHGAVQRVRPKVMTVACAGFGLVPIMWSTGAGADVMKRIAAPMIGGLFTSFLMELLVYPAIYLLWRKRELPREEGEQATVLRGWHKLAIGSGVAVAIIVAAVMFFARGGAAQPLYPKYETVRQALVKDSLPDAKARAKELAEAARENDRDAIAAQADAVSKANELEAARHAFAQLSDAMIAYRNESKEAPKPVIAYCSMAKHSWLQPNGPISNPYLGASMTACGEIQSN
jgi:predicted RND superfamily exporter protein